MKLIVHDLDEKSAELLFKDKSGIRCISDDKSIHHCIGCLGCWLKDPGECVIKDKYCNMGELISKSEEFIIISKCCYGGFSPFVKNVLDRSISYVHPYFEIRNGQMHHKKRYDTSLSLSVYFYGDDINDSEKELTHNLVRAVSINLNTKVKEVAILSDIQQIGSKL